MLKFLLIALMPGLAWGAAPFNLIPNHAKMAQNSLEFKNPDTFDHDWKLNSYFGSVFAINLPACKERLESIKEQLQAIGCKKFEIFEGVDGRKDVDEAIWKKLKLNWARLDLSTPEGQARFDRQRQGEAGCYLSHYRIIQLVKSRFDAALKTYRDAKTVGDEALQKKAYKELLKNRSVLILEDDTAFGLVASDGQSASLESAGKIFRSAMAELPPKWDMLYFMTYSRKICPNEPYSPHLIKVNAGFSAIAYVVNYSLYGKLIQELSKIENPNVHTIMPVDSVYADLHRFHRCYAVLPSIAYQKNGMSTINTVITPYLLQFQPYPPMP